MSVSVRGKRYLLGIDPGLNTMGVAIGKDKKLIIVKGGSLLEMLKWITTEFKKRGIDFDEVVAVVENPDLDSPSFKMWGMFKLALEDYVNNLLLRAMKSGATKTLRRVLIWAGFSQKKAMIPIQKPKLNYRESPPTEVNIKDLESSFRIAMNYSQKVGQNKAAAKLIIQVLEEKGIPVLEVAPSERQKAYRDEKGGKVYHDKPNMLKMPTKTNAAQFEEVTGYGGRSNEHGRDAGTLISGVTVRNVLMRLEIQAAKRGKVPGSYPGVYNDNEFLIKKG